MHHIDPSLTSRSQKTRWSQATTSLQPPVVHNKITHADGNSWKRALCKTTIVYSIFPKLLCSEHLPILYLKKFPTGSARTVPPIQVLSLVMSLFFLLLLKRQHLYYNHLQPWLNSNAIVPFSSSTFPDEPLDRWKLWLRTYGFSCCSLSVSVFL